jgi:hypothetical protein
MVQASPQISRDEIVSIVSKFYDVFTAFPYLPASAILTPPLTGWPEETRQTFLKMGKTDAVVDLMSHLPYIDSENWEILHETKPLSYVSRLRLNRIERGKSMQDAFLDPMHQEVPAHVISLTCGRNYGIWALLDLQAGMSSHFPG